MMMMHSSNKKISRMVMLSFDVRLLLHNLFFFFFKNFSYDDDDALFKEANLSNGDALIRCAPAAS